MLVKHIGFQVTHCGIILSCLVLLLVVISAGCTQSDAASAVEAYYRALVEKDRDRFIGLVCTDWEADATREFDSFGAVDATLEGFSCEQASKENNHAVVTCKGGILVVYGNEDNQLFNLEDYTYQVAKEDGEWRMCGYE